MICRHVCRSPFDDIFVSVGPTCNSVQQGINAFQHGDLVQEYNCRRYISSTCYHSPYGFTKMSCFCLHPSVSISSCKQKSMVERQNEIIQPPSVLAINRTGGQHIAMEDVVVLGGVRIVSIFHFINAFPLHLILLLKTPDEYSY